VKDVEMRKRVLIEAFAMTVEPLGWYFAGFFSGLRERFDFYKKSAEAGCSWGQVAYGWYFRHGTFVEKDMKANLEWLEKAVNQNNPEAMYWLGDWFRYGGDDAEKAVAYYRAAAELGWKMSMVNLSNMLRDGKGCGKDLRQAVIWGAKGESASFGNAVRTARVAFEDKNTEKLDCDFDQLCYTLGWRYFWYVFVHESWNGFDAFSDRCLDYYCSCVELQQKSIVSFLLYWNQTTGGVKGPGQMIAQIVWEGREDNLVQAFGQNEGEEPEMKRIKK
jgi:TPR repeat protein